MKIHNDFTLFWRVVPSGKRVVYFYAYDENGKRLNGKSTGETTLTAARLKCNRLLKTGALAAKKNHQPTFAEYAIGWWDWDNCEYLKKRRKRANLTKGYADLSKRHLDNKLIPYFGKMRMNAITLEVIEAFIDGLIKEGKKHASINGYIGALKTMLNEAEERKIITRNPLYKVGKLVNNAKEIRIITPDEFKQLFVGDWKQV